MVVARLEASAVVALVALAHVLVVLALQLLDLLIVLAHGPPAILVGFGLARRCHIDGLAGNVHRGGYEFGGGAGDAAGKQRQHAEVGEFLPARLCP